MIIATASRGSEIAAKRQIMVMILLFIMVLLLEAHRYYCESYVYIHPGQISDSLYIKVLAS